MKDIKKHIKIRCIFLEDNNMKRKNRNVSYRRAYHITGEIEF